MSCQAFIGSPTLAMSSTLTIASLSCHRADLSLESTVAIGVARGLEDLRAELFGHPVCRELSRLQIGRRLRNIDLDDDPAGERARQRIESREEVDAPSAGFGPDSEVSNRCRLVVSVRGTGLIGLVEVHIFEMYGAYAIGIAGHYRLWGHCRPRQRD